MTPDRHPVPVPNRAPARRTPGALTSVVVRRAVPAVAAATGALVATLAAERALGSLVMSALGRAGHVLAATPFRAVTPGLRRPGGVTRVVVTETIVVERIRRRR